MFTNLHQLLGGKPDDTSSEHAFVEEVRQNHPKEPRSRRSEWVLSIGWVLIAIKCVVVWWLIQTYKVPIHPGWVIYPTIGAASVCTWLYWRR